MKVEVYKNLHNGKWSIRNADTKLVVGHADFVELENCTLKVSEAGRQRVLREKKKNVHAVVQGYISYVHGFVPFKGREVIEGGTALSVKDRVSSTDHSLVYNPYKGDSFVAINVESGKVTKVKNAKYVILSNYGRNHVLFNKEEV